MVKFVNDISIEGMVRLAASILSVATVSGRLIQVSLGRRDFKTRIPPHTTTATTVISEAVLRLGLAKYIRGQLLELFLECRCQREHQVRPHQRRKVFVSESLVSKQDYPGLAILCPQA